MRDKFFMIDGGVGRVICAQPALRKYFKNNPDSGSLVGVAGWDSVYWGDPILQPKSYNLDNKGVFDNFIRPRDIVAPEPYKMWSYYNQKKDLIQAFDEIINNTNDHSDLGIPQLFLNKEEELFANNFRSDLEKNHKTKKMVVIQPFGRSASINNDKFIDTSSRSISATDYIKLGKKLSKHCTLVLFAEKPFHMLEDDFSIKTELDFRNWFALIEASDYFIGCDSLGQHVARAFNKKGTVVLGSTFKENISYGDWFNVWEKAGTQKTYSPIRINGIDCMFADRMNDSNMDLSDKDINDLYNSIMEDMNKK